MKYDTTRTESGEKTSITAAAPASEEAEIATETETKEPGRDTALVPFKAFRNWVNRRLTVKEVLISHGGISREVNEITPDGQLRLTIPKDGDEEQSFALVPFDDIVIREFLSQLI